MYEKRYQRLQRAMKENQLDAVALNPGPSLVYLTGLHFHLSERPTLLILPAEGEAGLILPELETAKLASVPYPVTPFPFGDNPAHWADVYRSALTRMGLAGKQVGVEPNRLRVLELRFLEEAGEAAPGTRFISAAGVLAALRMVKDADEIRRMRHAVHIAQDALRATVSSARMGMTEHELAGELTLQVLRAGGDPEMPFSPIVSSGPNSANPHASPGERRLASGDLLVIDWGAAVRDYFSDLTRTFAIGEVEDELKKIAQVTLEANQAARAAARPGIPIGKVDQAARSVIEKAGYGANFIHRTGHGLGMEAHEEPYCYGENTLELRPGMVFTIEPGIYLPGRNGVRIEDNVVITAEGAESLSDYPRELAIIGA